MSNPIDLYEEYIYERESARLLHNEYGFIKYKIDKDICLVGDMYIKDNYRNLYTKKLIDELAVIAKESGCTLFEAHVHLDTANPQLSLKACLAYGFIPTNANQNTIYLYKEI